MSMNVRPGYINPLTMLDKKTTPAPGLPAPKQTDKVSELQTKQQQLQNQMLLLKATGTDSAGAATETQKALEAELEKVNTALRTAKADTAQAAGAAEPAQRSGSRPCRDVYEPEQFQTASPGLYQVEQDEEQGYRISFSPYSEG